MKKKLKDRIKNTIKEVKDALLREDKHLANELERSVGEVRQQFAALQRAADAAGSANETLRQAKTASEEALKQAREQIQKLDGEARQATFDGSKKAKEIESLHSQIEVISQFVEDVANRMTKDIPLTRSPAVEELIRSARIPEWFCRVCHLRGTSMMDELPDSTTKMMEIQIPGVTLVLLYEQSESGWEAHLLTGPELDHVERTGCDIRSLFAWPQTAI